MLSKSKLIAILDRNVEMIEKISKASGSKFSAKYAPNQRGFLCFFKGFRK